SIIDRPEELPDAINLWRAIVAWFGGFFALVVAFAVLAPRGLGGYEIYQSSSVDHAIGRLRGAPSWADSQRHEEAGERIAIAVIGVAPIYIGLTALLALGLLISGHTPFSASTAAMSLISTTGLLINSEGMFHQSNGLGEVVAVAFLFLAATRHIFVVGAPLKRKMSGYLNDAEVKLLALFVIISATWLFGRHWVGALDIDQTTEVSEPLRAAWGAFFTALSFATTAGVVSESWDAARVWSGMGNPSLILLGLAVTGGGIASTAGGVKLLRAYALFRHGEREMERLVRPSSIAGSGVARRGLRREGAQIAWVFVMLFLVSLAGAMLALSLTELSFELSLMAALAALSNTGPLFNVAGGDVSYLKDVSAEGRSVLIVVMLLGRVEVLAVIAMLNPGNWR
ncbi:MAG: potassium transporter TrkG, partial [Pikeienuella sp.]